MNPMKGSNVSNKEIALIVDVETAGGFARPLVYDLGIAAVVRSTGEIIERHSLVIEDVFYGMPHKMATAYYADKLPMYHQGIEMGAWRVVSFWSAWRLVRSMVERYNVRRVYAYNAAFDVGALNSTFRTITNGRGRNFFPKNLQVCCIWHMACQTVLKQSRYRKFAAAHGLVSEAGNYRTSAEAAYAYHSNTPDFVEEHTGLADVEIEAEILHWVLRQKKRVNENIAHNPWRLAQVL